MFRLATPQNTRRAQPQTGSLTPLAIPAKGLNARDALAVMGPEYAISLVNVLSEPFGLKTRKGYTEWATNVSTGIPVQTMMSYYPASAAPPGRVARIRPRALGMRLLSEGPAASIAPAGKLFACASGRVLDVTVGGNGPWIPMSGVGGPSMGDHWTWLNFQNIAGAFLIACNNDSGGYAYYNGSAWTTPTLGTGAGQITGCDPSTFCYVVEHMKRLWFIEKGTTRAWYLPVSQIVGTVTAFNFGEQFKHGGELVALVRWTVDAGVDINDKLVAISSQGDVVVYQGTDPDTVGDFVIQGVWYVGALPVGRQCVINSGADVHILSQFGVTPLSRLLTTIDMSQQEQMRLTYMISPVIARLMRESSSLVGWKIVSLPKEELFLIGVPPDSPEFGGQFFALKLSTGAWSLLNTLPYSSFVSIDADVFSGTYDGRVVRAFDGPVDNVLIGTTTGDPIQCQVTPAYNSMEPGPGTGAQQKVFKMLRPTFITTTTPTIAVTIMTDYGGPGAAVIPTLPHFDEALWDVDLWDVAKWTGLQGPIKTWIGVNGVGFAGTAQIDYLCGGETLLASIDFWTERGGVM